MAAARVHSQVQVWYLVCLEDLPGGVIALVCACSPSFLSRLQTLPAQTTSLPCLVSHFRTLALAHPLPRLDAEHSS